MEGITLGDLMTLAGVLVAAGTMVAQIRHVAADVTDIKKQVGKAAEERSTLRDRVTRMETRMDFHNADTSPISLRG